MNFPRTVSRFASKKLFPQQKTTEKKTKNNTILFKILANSIIAFPLYLATNQPTNQPSLRMKIERSVIAVECIRFMNISVKLIPGSVASVVSFRMFSHFDNVYVGIWSARRTLIHLCKRPHAALIFQSQYNLIWLDQFGCKTIGMLLVWAF